MSSHRKTTPGAQAPKAPGAATPVEFSHLEKVSARDCEAPSTPPTTTPFLL